MKRIEQLYSRRLGAKLGTVCAAAAIAATIVVTGGGAATSQARTPKSVRAAGLRARTTAATSLGLINPGTLTVGINPQFKPEDWIQNGKPVGFEVDALRSLAASMKAKLSIKTLSFTGLIPGLQAHQFDMVAQSLSYTPARAKVVSFTKPYIPYAVILAVPKGKAASVTSPAALNKPGDVITALQGSLSESIAQKLFPKATIQPLSDQNSTLLDVATGRASGVVVESTILAQFNKSNPGELAVAHIAKPFELEYGRYAVPHGDTKLVNYINSWICKSSKQNGTLAKAYTKEFGAKWPGLPAC